MNKFYPLKHWLATLVIGPLLPSLYGIIYPSKADSVGILDIYGLTLYLGSFFSFPAFVVYYLTFFGIIKFINSPLLIKLVLNIVAIVCVFVTFKIIGGTLELELFIAYSFAIVICSLFLKLRNKLTEQEIENVDKKNSLI